MKQILGTSYIDEKCLSEIQLADLQHGMVAAAAFWRSALVDPTYEQPRLRPHGRCIFAAMSVLDVLHATGRPDARVMKTGLDIRVVTDDPSIPMRVLTAGHPDTPFSPHSWNAHLVVRLGDILIDPSFAQTRRDWNDSPHYAAFLAGAPEGHTVILQGNLQMKSTTVYVQHDADRSTQVAYFQLARKVDVLTRGWQKNGEAKPIKRREIVNRAISIFNAQQNHNEEIAA
ncbi:MAG: hypothetical protein IBJ07_06500 [Rhizobiaceae bacterium]|nr:hypothetical protein [Rhizobiaceae bacterium]